jgi:protein subunit release factor A
VELGGIWKDEIDDLKENLERKEYLLQISEQRVSSFEKLLFQLGARDPQVQRTLQEQNIILKDRKISNVVIENSELKDLNKQLLEYNSQLREQLEQVLAKLQEGHGADPELAEEISIFQNKMADNYPSRVLDSIRNKVGGLE